MSTLILRLSGPVQVERDGERLEGFESGKALGLLAYLALRDGPVSRQHLAGLFWGEFPDKRAHGNLRRVLHNLGKLLSDCLYVDRRRVHFRPSELCCVDVLAFRELVPPDVAYPGSQSPVVPDVLEEALQWFRGPLLEGLSLDDCPEFELWLVTERERWQQRVVGVLEQLIAYDTRHGRYACALNHVDHLLQLTPWQEAAHRQKMLLLARTGKRGAALRQYDLCCRVLKEDLDVEPLRETQALYRRLRATRDTARPTLDKTPYPTAFIGREREVAAITDRLMNPDCRLLTLVGLGGSGKTRLARQVAVRQDAHFLDGVVFVPLTSVSSPDLIVPAIAAAVGLVFQGRSEPREQLLNYLHQREMLLVLDNFEHLLGEGQASNVKRQASNVKRETSNVKREASGVGGGEVLAELLCHAPLVKLLVTSRECLNLRWEWVFRVRGLSLPSSESPHLDGVSLEAYSAVQLFAHIAQRRCHDFNLEREQAAVTRICRLVEGLPLGIELAAVWTATHTCVEIAQSITQGLSVLQTTLLDMPARHRSLRAVLDYSWQLLSREEQRSFMRMACFQGSFSASAAAQVAGATPALLASLVDKSLLRQTLPSRRGGLRGGEKRYAMHSLAHRYAEAKLRQSGSVAVTEVQAAHARFYVKKLQTWEPDLMGPHQVQTLDAMQLEQGNLRRAWQWAVETRAYDFLDVGLGAFFDFFVMRGLLREGRTLFADTATFLRDDASPKLWGRVLARLGVFHYRLGQYPQAIECLDKSLALLRTEGPVSEVAFNLAYRGLVAYAMAEYDKAWDFLRKSLSLYRQTDDTSGIARVLNSLGIVAYMQGAYSEARRYYQESLSLCRVTGSVSGIARALSNLGLVANATGQYQEAVEPLQESLALRRTLRGQTGVASTLNNLGITLYHLGRVAEAQACYQECLDLAREVGSQRDVGLGLINLGYMAWQQGQYAEARRHYRECLTIRREIGDRYGVAYVLNNLGDVALDLEEYDKARANFSEALHIAMAVQAMPVVLESLVGLARLLARQGDVERAVAWLTVVAQHPATIEEVRDNAIQLLETLTEQLSASVAARAKAQGQALGLEEVVANFESDVSKTQCGVT